MDYNAVSIIIGDICNVSNLLIQISFENYVEIKLFHRIHSKQHKNEPLTIKLFQKLVSRALTFMQIYIFINVEFKGWNLDCLTNIVTNTTLSTF